MLGGLIFQFLGLDMFYISLISKANIKMTVAAHAMTFKL
jgi:hypothetical protein